VPKPPRKDSATAKFRLPDAVKTAAPALGGMLARPRLEARLAQIAAPAKWLVAPSGTGKSTLVASYARGTRRTVVWYRLDPRDDDPAYFYDQLGSTLAVAIGKLPSFPRFLPEDRQREGQFAERFAAAFHSASRKRLIVVFDDAHRVREPARYDTLAHLVALADLRMEVVFVANTAAPPAFFDAIAARRLALCNDLPLEFEPSECVALAKGLRLVHPDGQALSALTGGHAAALVLACELLRGASAPSVEGHSVVDQIHLHLLDRMLDTASTPRRDLLERTAFAPQITLALAIELAGEEAAAELEPLAARGLLRRIANDGEPIYEAHGLVRRGMQTLLRKRRGVTELRQLSLATAAALQRHDAHEDAFALLIECDAPEAAAAVLENLAERYARSGEAALLARSLAQLPASVATSDPWLCFWAGQGLLGVDEATARDWFAQSYVGFERANDRNGMRLAAACVVTAFGLEYGDIRSMDEWMERHSRAGGDEAVPSGSAHEASLCLGVMCVAIARGAFPPGFDTEALVARLGVLIDEPTAWLTPDQRVEAARLLIDYQRIFGTNEQAQAVVVATRAHAESEATSALQRGRYWIAAGVVYFEDGLHAPAVEFLARARRLVEETGSRRLAFGLGMHEVNFAMKRNDLEAAVARLSDLEALAIGATPAERAEHARYTARVLLIQGHAREGLRWAQEALKMAVIAGYTGGHTRAFRLECIYAQAANHRFTEAMAINDTFLQELEGGDRDAALALDSALRCLAGGLGDPDVLRNAFAYASKSGFVNMLARARDAIAPLCERALASDIEPDFVRRLIAIQNLDPPDGAGPSWPWPVRIRTLGGFELEIHGERYTPAHKTQDKPLELLKLLVTAQVLGRDSVNKLWVAERLWPDADTASGRKSLDMTVSRLRRLLSEEDAVLSQEGRLQLSPRHVWTDVAPLLRALSRVGRRRDEHASGRQSTAAADVAAVIDLYRGPFLVDEDPPPWLIAGREAVTAAVRTALLTADTIFEGREDARLIPAIERAFAADPTSEDLARALMRAHARHGRQSEALVTYRRVREMLSIVLGVAPSTETERLKDEIYAAAAADPAARYADAPRHGVSGPR
jgi:LuxR family maltose regulon positive regulatory protein